MHGITREERLEYHGGAWRVVLEFGPSRPRYERVFPDRKYRGDAGLAAGKRVALEVAQVWRDGIVARERLAASERQARPEHLLNQNS